VPLADESPLETFVWRDIEATAVATPTPSFVSWRVVEQIGVMDNGTVLYERAGAGSSSDLVENIDDAETLIEGSIKWDGCGNLAISPDVMLHLCGYRSVQQFTTLLDRLYEMTAWYVDNADGLPPPKYWPSQ
jgi:hypothetical protein